MIHVLDIGSNTVDGPPPYDLLEDKRVLCVEPQIEWKSDYETLDKFVGDGQKHIFYKCKGSGMSSLLEPNFKVLKKLPNLDDLAEILETHEIETVRLDDIKEAKRIDYLKMDVQGSELSILRNGREKLKQSLVWDVEVSFVPLYKSQPVFGEIDLEARRQGFITATMFPKFWNGTLIEADVIYVRDYINTELSDKQKNIIKTIIREWYGRELCL